MGLLARQASQQKVHSYAEYKSSISQEMHTREVVRPEEELLGARSGKDNIRGSHTGQQLGHEADVKGDLGELGGKRLSAGQAAVEERDRPAGLGRKVLHQEPRHLPSAHCKFDNARQRVLRGGKPTVATGGTSLESRDADTPQSHLKA